MAAAGCNGNTSMGGGRRRKASLVHLLRGREYMPSRPKTSARILRIIVASPNYKYEKVWEISSKREIMVYRNGPVVDLMKTQIYYGYGKGHLQPLKQGYAEGLQNPVTEWTFKQQTHLWPKRCLFSPNRPSPEIGRVGCSGGLLYAIKADRLLVLEPRSGATVFEAKLLENNRIGHNIDMDRLEDVRTLVTHCLNGRLCYRAIDWLEEGRTFVIHCHKWREEGDVSEVLTRMIVFSVLPVRLLCVFDVNRHIFGQHAQSVGLRHGHLTVESHVPVVGPDHVINYVTHICLYDFHKIVAMNQTPPVLVPDSSLLTNAQLSYDPTLVLTERPPVVREIFPEPRVLANFYPHGQYLLIDYNMLHVGTHRAGHTIASGTSVQSCRAGQRQVSLGHGDERVYSSLFHPDDTCRMLLTRRHRVHMLHFTTEGEPKGRESIRRCFSIPFTMAALRRQLLASYSPQELHDLVGEVTGDTLLEQAGYCPEMDMLTVSGTYLPSRRPYRNHGVVAFHDNVTGCHVRTVLLPHGAQTVMSEKIMVEADSLIQSLVNDSHSHSVNVYRLVSRQDGPDHEAKYPDRNRKSPDDVISGATAAAPDLPPRRHERCLNITKKIPKAAVERGATLISVVTV